MTRRRIWRATRSVVHSSSSTHKTSRTQPPPIMLGLATPINSALVWYCPSRSWQTCTDLFLDSSQKASSLSLWCGIWIDTHSTIFPQSKNHQSCDTYTAATHNNSSSCGTRRPTPLIGKTFDTSRTRPPNVIFMSLHHTIAARNHRTNFLTIGSNATCWTV